LHFARQLQCLTEPLQTQSSVSNVYNLSQHAHRMPAAVLPIQLTVHNDLRPRGVVADYSSESFSAVVALEQWMCMSTF
jgi:hypothetical protein